MTNLPETENGADHERTATSIINRIVAGSLRQRFLILFFALLLTLGGAYSFKRLPVDAYPDLSPPQVEIITQWEGHAAEEVERLITVPMETEMNGIANQTVIRSISLYGLSDVRLTFAPGTDNYFARQQAFERLGDVELPSGVTPSVAPLFSPSGLIYRYVLDSPDRSPMDLKILEDWVVERQFKSVPGVADDSGLGGPTMQYQVLLDPAKVAAVGLSVPVIVDSLSNSNGNAGGGFYSQGGQFYYVRGLGRIQTTEDVGNVVLAVHNGTPVLVKDVGQVVIGAAPRLGQFGFNDRDEAVEGVILMRKGEQAQIVLNRIEQKTQELNKSVLPPDVKVRPFYDRRDLIALTTRTVEDNLLRGMLLVIVILIFFLYDIRSGLIVAVTIPLSLLFAFICLDLKHVPANLLSIGAIDFGILVDGAVVMMENIFRRLALNGESENPQPVPRVIIAAAAEVDRPIFYAVAVIVAGFIPIYALTGPSGELFAPMADTTIFALAGALLIALTLVPVLAAWALRRGVREHRNFIFDKIRDAYTVGLDFSLARPWLVTFLSVAIFAASLLLVPSIGAEFMPHLDEGSLWVRATMPSTISFEAASALSPKIRAILRSFPQVTVVTNELGRPDDGTDPTGFFNNEFFVGLKPYDKWTGPIRSKEKLIDAIAEKLKAFPGITFNYTQPAEDAVDEAETGLKSSLAVKVFGPDLTVLENKANAIKTVLGKVRGIDEISVVRELGQPSLTVTPNREKIARYGLNVSDINSLIEAAVGGTAATQVVQGERLFDLVVRLQPQYRQTPEQIANILVATPGGQQIPLKELADIDETSGASFIYRENNERYIGVQYSIKNRDLASAVRDAQEAVEKAVTVPTGYRMVWGGEYENYTASRKQLQIIVPLTLFLIFLLLFMLYSNMKFPLITVIAVILSSPVGGLIALKLSGTPFSVSSGIGFIALFGVSVQTAVIYISYANELRRDGRTITDATREAAILRLRPIMMTALVAALGLLPAALSHGIGSDTQRPFALVIVGGLFSRLLISVFLMPALYAVVARPHDKLEV
ncbi:MAG TPA: CusA/CzcA family heavy metal efflux RND transporter [Thermoanaerobaculia bacterium]|jgi:cobalt-zinc-cadmium resistance protein CzcA|nr:CusA/CzcA family heavy metal efflux RND transporter [Thermoanaerobaculia bacterium]